ncbi:Trp biosynthesis-associated membrane protein [Umezawaea endophytica]|uniref:Trp biosynthesis-associated membrane protein n=1 Tax=Umezawaea endophytica TaxID=1654476 RepID=A0A9X2VKH2_9PSEU|nr:Trp biosynthesis-associated membrane protein [Umezawaea endophytica]MCS7478285.1 Trp biosynthesis-associated membrane protein [Umezawaea endophytica]
MVLLLLLGALALWGASGLTWVTEAVERPGAAATTAARSGADVAPGLVPLAVLSATAVAAVVALSGWVRRVLGGVVLAVGLGAAWVVVAAPGTVPPKALAVLGALLVVGAGVVLLVRGQAMPRLGGSYQTPAAAKGASDPDKDLWRALERGDDPTDRG